MSTIPEFDTPSIAVTSIFIFYGAMHENAKLWSQEASDAQEGMLGFADRAYELGVILASELYAYQLRDPDCDFPGVFDYEVSEELGKWVASKWPERVTNEEFTLEAQERIQKFFGQAPAPSNFGPVDRTEPDDDALPIYEVIGVGFHEKEKENFDHVLWVKAPNAEFLIQMLAGAPFASMQKIEFSDDEEEIEFTITHDDKNDVQPLREKLYGFYEAQIAGLKGQ